MTLRGVNLGNWLLLERWMQPALFGSSGAHDEFGLCTALGADAEPLLRRHRETFITADDFRWLHQRGMNAVRIPLGYWLLNPEPPFVGGAQMLDQAIQWCEQYHLSAVLDLHGLPGFQGPEHHTGRSKHFRWPSDPDCVAQSLDLIEQVAQRYQDSPAVKAISLVNEPSAEIPAEALLDFYHKGTERVRRHLPADRVAVIIAAFTEARLPEFHRKVDGKNILTDIHPYPCFCPWESGELLQYAAWGPTQHAPHLRKVGPEDLVVGEWSLGIAASLKPAFHRLAPFQQDLLMRSFANGQLLSFEQTAGWFFWSYRVEASDPLTRATWCFRDAVHRGWLPDRFDDPVPASPPATGPQ